MGGGEGRGLRAAAAQALLLGLACRTGVLGPVSRAVTGGCGQGFLPGHSKGVIITRVIPAAANSSHVLTTHLMPGAALINTS